MGGLELELAELAELAELDELEASGGTGVYIGFFGMCMYLAHCCRVQFFSIAWVSFC